MRKIDAPGLNFAGNIRHAPSANDAAPFLGDITSAANTETAGSDVPTLAFKGLIPLTIDSHGVCPTFFHPPLDGSAPKMQPALVLPVAKLMKLKLHDLSRQQASRGTAAC